MIQKNTAHWDLPRVPENEFLFRPNYDIKEEEKSETNGDSVKEFNDRNKTEKVTTSQ